MFLLSCIWAKILFDSGALHSFVTASSVDVLGLGTRVRIDQIYQDCELQI